MHLASVCVSSCRWCSDWKESIHKYLLNIYLCQDKECYHIFRDYISNVDLDNFNEGICLSCLLFCSPATSKWINKAIISDNVSMIQKQTYFMTLQQYTIQPNEKKKKRNLVRTHCNQNTYPHLAWKSWRSKILLGCIGVCLCKNWSKTIELTPPIPISNCY